MKKPGRGMVSRCARLIGLLSIAAAVGSAGGCSSSSGGAKPGTGGAGGRGTGGAPSGSGGGTVAGSGGATVGSGGATSSTGGGSAGGTGGGGGGGSGTGGTGNSAGSGGPISDGGVDARPRETIATFTTSGDLEGFHLNSYSNVNNLGDATREAGVLAMLAWDGTEGIPAPGALKLTASYSDFGQFVIVQHDFSELDVRDWTGRKLHISLKIAGGFAAGGAVKVFVQDQIAGTDGGAATFPYADQYQTAAPGADWQEFTFALAEATYRSPEWDERSITQVRWFGVNLDAGMAPVDSDAGVKPTPATVYIDNVWLE